MYYLLVVIIFYFLILFIHRYILRILSKSHTIDFDVMRRNVLSEDQPEKEEFTDKPTEKSEQNDYVSEADEQELIQLSEDELNNELDEYIENIDEDTVKESNTYNTEYTLDQKNERGLDNFYNTLTKETYPIKENNWVPTNENILNGGEIFNGVTGYTDDSMFSNF